MKRKILLFVSLLAVVACFFAVSVSAETPSCYIEFKVKLSGGDDYVNAYVQDIFPSDPMLDLKEPLYLDVDFTQEIVKNDIVGLDFSNATPVNSGKNVVIHFRNTESPLPNCKEIKWFNTAGAVSVIGAITFQNWTNLESFDFGIAKDIVDRAFSNCGLKTLVIPETVTSIKGGAFGGNKSLTSLTILGNPTMASGTFSGCDQLACVNIDNMTTIGDGMFSECKALTSFAVPEGVTKIGKEAFYKCTNLTSITFNDGLKTIGSTAFLGSGVVSVTIPAGVESIGSSAFDSCKSLETVIFEEGCSATVGSSAFMSTSALSTLVLSEGITEIPYQCFYGSRVKSVTIPDSVTKLANRAFSENGALEELIISENSKLAELGSAFNGSKIKSIYLPTGVKITASPFSQCHNLEYIYNLENAVLAIEVDGAEQNIIPSGFFHECRVLKEVKIPNGVTSIGASAFNRCGGDDCLVIYIPASVTKIDKSAFAKTTDWLTPKKAVIYYCGGSAADLLALTDDGEGNVNAFLKEKIDAGNFANYAGLDFEYGEGAIVGYANLCDLYYGGEHLESDKISHTFVKDDGSVGAAYMSTFKVACPCDRECGIENVIETLPAFFTCLGYSAPESGIGGFVIGYTVNGAAIERYEEITGYTLTYGAFVTSKNSIGKNEIFDESGNTVKGVVVAEMSGGYIDGFELKIMGLVSEAQRNVPLAVGAYVTAKKDTETENTYLQQGKADGGEKYAFISLNQIVEALS